MHGIPGMDEEGARLAAEAVLGTLTPAPKVPDDPPVTNPVTTEPVSPLL
jgi:hypothetical protein